MGFLCVFLVLSSEQLQILLSMGDAEGAAAVAREAVQRHSQSVSVWSLGLQTLIQLESADVGQLFRDALAHVDPKVVCSHNRIFSAACFTKDNAEIWSPRLSLSQGIWAYCSQKI